jgi:LDH2 family malate/lactate/ureidoglycolate dehydrogenase
MEAGSNTELHSSRKLEPLIRDFLVSLGAADIIASDVAHSLIVMSLRGVDSHGIMLLPGLLKRIKSGRCQIKKTAEFITDYPSIGVVDAYLSPGQHAGMAAVRHAVTKASQTGVYLATIKNSNHFGGCTPFLLHAVSSGMIAFVASNSAQSMAIYGAKIPNMGNNPLGFGAPVKGSHPFLFDFSSAVMSYGKLANYKAQGLKIPEGAFFKPTERREANVAYEIAGQLTDISLPFGGYKGASIAVMLEVLSGILSGGAFGRTTELIDDNGHFHGPSHFVLVINPALTSGNNEIFTERMRSLISDIRGKEEINQLRIPGDQATVMEKERLKYGIPIPLSFKLEMQRLAEEFDSSFTWD